MYMMNNWDIVGIYNQLNIMDLGLKMDGLPLFMETYLEGNDDDDEHVDRGVHDTFSLDCWRHPFHSCLGESVFLQEFVGWSVWTGIYRKSCQTFL